MKFYIPTKPYTVTDAINRRWVAQGSTRNAQLCSDADYNGHALSLTWNGYRGYWVGEYHWGERVVFTRGSKDFATALDATKREFARQGRGASCRIHIAQPTYEKDHQIPYLDACIAIARADADLREGEETEFPWQDWKFKHYAAACRDMEIWCVPSDSLLIRAENEEAYLTARDAEFKRRERVSASK